MSERSAWSLSTDWPRLPQSRAEILSVDERAQSVVVEYRWTRTAQAGVESAGTDRTEGCVEFFLVHRRVMVQYINAFMLSLVSDPINLSVHS